MSTAHPAPRKVRRPRYTPLGKVSFAIVIEMLEIIGFVIGFWAIVQLPAKSMNRDLATIGTDWPTSHAAVKDELTILVDSSIESRTLGFAAMACIVTAFILRTIVSRILRMPSDI